MYVANHKFIARNFLLWQQQDQYLFWSCLCYQVSKNQSWFIVNCPSCSAAMTPWVCNKYRNTSVTAIWLAWRLETKYMYMYTLFYQALVCYLQNDSTGNRRSVKAKSPRGGGGLPYMGYIGMCGPKGYGFSAVFGHKLGIDFSHLPPFWS